MSSTQPSSSIIQRLQLANQQGMSGAKLDVRRDASVPRGSWKRSRSASRFPRRETAGVPAQQPAFGSLELRRTEQRTGRSYAAFGGYSLTDAHRLGRVWQDEAGRGGGGRAGGRVRGRRVDGGTGPVGRPYSCASCG